MKHWTALLHYQQQHFHTHLCVCVCVCLCVCVCVCESATVDSEVWIHLSWVETIPPKLLIIRSQRFLEWLLLKIYLKQKSTIQRYCPRKQWFVPWVLHVICYNSLLFFLVVLVSTCKNNNEGSLLPTLISEEMANISTDCSSLPQGEVKLVLTRWCRTNLLHPEEDWSSQLKSWPLLCWLKLVAKNLVFCDTANWEVLSLSKKKKK